MNPIDICMREAEKSNMKMRHGSVVIAPSGKILSKGSQLLQEY